MTTSTTDANDVAFPEPIAKWVKDPKFSHTQLGNAERLVQEYGRNIKYCHAWKSWLVWDGVRWNRGSGGEVERMAMKTVRSIARHARTESDDELRSKIEAHAKRSESRYNLDAIVDIAKNMTGIQVLPDQFDGDKFSFNCLNGTIDLRLGTLRPHSREDLITKLSPVEYQPDSECPIWRRFVDRVLDGNTDLIDFMQKSIGYSLTGAVNEKALFFLHGNGDNGKTTLLEAIRQIMGDYAGTVDVEALMKKAQTNEKERAIADLLGKRFATSSEVAEGEAMHEARIKLLTGMSRLKGRQIYGSAFEFDPQFKLFIDANHTPSISAAENAIWNRLRLVPFTVSIPKKEQDKTLLSKLAAEAPGILSWAVRGCLRWQHEGLGAPRAVADATQSYRDAMDSVSQFIEDQCELNPEALAVFSDLYAAYGDWCRANREHAVGYKAFGTSLEARGFALVRTAGARYRRGLTIRANDVPVAEDMAYRA